jgi:acyl-CoA reductase-like NAD-dependent aldehyde dehydrogenase
VNAPTITAVDPATGADGASYPETTPEQLDALLTAAADARDDAGWRTTSVRAAMLDGIAERLRERAGEIVSLCEAETGLSLTRLTGEVERTWRQVARFAALIRSGEHHEAIIDRADPDFQPVARPDLRRMTVPLGPVAVFSASNFPLAFSVAGGDTASALAAGCPVICKAHPGHPGTSALVGSLIDESVAQSGLAPGMFGLVQTASIELATRLVRDDRIEAVGFTGSIPGGRAVFDAAAGRTRPIPVYAEMGSVNPVVVTAAAAAERGDAIAELLAGAITRDAGQLCTKPGLVFVPAGADGDALARTLGAAVDDAETTFMLGPRLLGGAQRAVDGLEGSDAVTRLGRGGPAPDDALALPAAVYATTATALREDPSLAQERFGPITLVVGYVDLDDLLVTLDGLEGQLTGTLQLAGEGEDRHGARAIVDHLLPRVGRIVIDGVSTGVAVTAAQFHGGPYPASTASATTSVGTLAIRRFLRPVAFQNAPQWLLPEPLRD